VAALFILAAGAQRTGLLSAVVGRLLGAPQRRGVAHARLLVPAALASAALNNTPQVAILIPDILAWARRRRRNASRYLLPLSYAVILGGILTVLGTSTNLVVSGLLEDAGEEPLRMFEMAKIGLPVFVVGMLVLFSMSIPLLPNRVGAPEQLEAATKEFLVEMRVTHDRSVAGRTVEAAGLRGLTGVYLVRVRRDGRTIAPVATGERLETGDVLAFAGDVSNVLDLQRMRGLEGLDNDTIAAMDVAGRGLYEVVVGRPLPGIDCATPTFEVSTALPSWRSIGPGTGSKTNSAMFASGTGTRWSLLRVPTSGLAGPSPPISSWLRNLIRRPYGRSESASYGAGDDRIRRVLIARLGHDRRGFAPCGRAIFVTRVLTFSEAKRAIDVDVILLIGAAFGLGAAVEQSGLAAEIADGFVGALGGYGTFGLALAIVLATSVLTEIITNNAAAVVVFPIALAIVGPAGIDVRIMATAASTSFLSPIGYQTNTMVYGPGSYRMSDYVRAGLPLTIAVQLTTATRVTVLG